jgi:hypothetical protein
MSAELTDVEVLRALGDESLRGYAISRGMEQHWVQAGHRRFMAYSTLYRYLGGMVGRGLLERRGLAYRRAGEVTA